MSTRFGIYLNTKDGNFNTEDRPEFQSEDNFIDLAFRGNGTGIRWTNDIAGLLPIETNVYPLDNNAQGISTIGDIFNEIKKQNNRL